MMNYVGSISIIDRGDAPAKAIIEKNTRSLAQRVADETKEELDKVMDRVDNIYVSYEMSTQTMFEHPRTSSPNIEYLEDIRELEEIIKDTVKKKKYQQQVTIFIVGFQDVCAQKMQLLQQVNQFFLDNSKLDEEELTGGKIEIDLEETSNKVNESLATAEELTKKLSDLNQDIIEWLVNYANNKASNKPQGMMSYDKGKKRLEKALEETKNQMNELGTKLLTLQTELEEKDEKFQQILKQLDAKTQEALRYKTAAEVAKKSATDSQEKLAKLQEEVDSKKIAISEAEREMEKLHLDQVKSLQKVHQQEIEELKAEHQEELTKLTGKSIGEPLTEEDKESRPSTKETKSKKSENKLVKPPAKTPNKGAKDKFGKSRDQADASIQDEAGDHSKAVVEKSNDGGKQAGRGTKNLETVAEGNGVDLSNAYELEDDDAWSSVPTNQLSDRFAQYRVLSQRKLKDLEDQLNVTLTKTHRKVNSLKSQFNEHKNKWEAERKVLIEQVEQAQKLQTDAEKEADAAMTQLEEFINEQEKLEEEEETKRQELIKTMSRPGTVNKQTTPAPAEKKQERSSPELEKPSQGVRNQSDNSEQELKNLLQQTDDAKAQEKNIRQGGGAASAPPAVEPTHGNADKTQIEREPISGSTEEEVRATSAKSRASLRNQFKSRLDETRHAVEERRIRSPSVPILTQKSFEDLVLEDDDEDDLPLPDDVKEGLYKEDTTDAGTSPPPGPKPSVRTSALSKASVSMAEHPIVQEFLRAYLGIHNFKEAISRVLEDKDQMSASQILAELDLLPFYKENKIVPQVKDMTENIYYVLNEISQVVNSVLQNDRGPVVSSLMMGMSRDQTQRTIQPEKTTVIADVAPATRGSQRSASAKGERESESSERDRQNYKELQDQYEKLQAQVSDETKKFEDQQNHNMVVMMEMQNTINQLQRELSNLGKQGKRPQSEGTVTTQVPAVDSSIMFTRLDSERNAKIMKKAVNEQKLDAQKYKEAMVQMDDYVSLPGQRLAHLVRKYVHHCHMKEIEENVQKSNSLNDNVFEILDKMESLQNQRARRWADRMDEMGLERLRLANLLMETLDSIEQESGIFLIKPMYSYRGREQKERFSGKISRPFRPQRTMSPQREVTSAYAPAPTPASNMRSVVRAQAKENAQPYPFEGQGSAVRYDPNRPLDGDQRGLLGASINYGTSQPRATWSMADSQPKGESPLYGNTPRILELDINRMMIGQNTISAQIGAQSLSNDRLVNAANSNLRSYMTVNRPSGQTERPSSASRKIGSPAPSVSPTNQSASSKRVRMSADIEVPSVMATPPPLPPIASGQNRPSSGTSRQTPTRIPSGDVPPSPPGSSLRHTPPGDFSEAPPTN